MNCKIFFVFLLIVSVTGCKSKSAFAYSQNIVSMEQSLVPDIKLTEENVGKYANAGNFDSVTTVSAKMEKEIDGKLNDIKTMPAPDAKGGEDFKQAAVKYFAYLESIYTGYKNYGQQKTDADRNQVKAGLVTLVGNKETVIADMKAAQQKFADANGFRLKEDNQH